MNLDITVKVSSLDSLRNIITQLLNMQKEHTQNYGGGYALNLKIVLES